MQSKKLFRTVALQSLAVASLALLAGSVADVKPAASASVTAWTGLLVTRGEETLNEPHAASRRVRPTVAPARRPRSFRKPQNTILPVLQQDEILPKHQKILDELLRILPSSCIARLQNVYVRYDHPEQRGLAGASTVILSGNVPDEEFRALAVHEMLGHFYELACLNGTASAANSGFYDGDTAIKADDPSAAFYAISWLNTSTQRPHMKANSFVSGYSPHDPFEDLAETSVAYLLQRKGLEKLAENNSVIAAKLAWMKTYMPSAVTNVAVGQYSWNGAPPWDMTKLAYVWRGATGTAVAVDNGEMDNGTVDSGQ